ncbi:MAG: biotin-dependent carboxyltransferase family protein [Balneola sp.]|nr:biotin-dependent carboxyltransferase family protein [Balneola sp.]MBO6651031.1 biotin-dependent carboxyltransferase family protein [Balneola sp.]MBO6711192.1 biotin-dependent carboxyltransferase family protein [Balneola sp.]MBO6800693.1 biotin-dependent carboxyltransferase family protein [Balneola sp.]MBO6869128.1 biotin-dependent carboxyltransferase family protein [Balneola sp.]
MGKLVVIDGGLFTTVQDSGRFGFRKYGVPVSGVMDHSSFELANELVGNPKRAPVLEMTLKGGKYRFETDSVVAVTGAQMSLTVNQENAPLNSGIKVKAGDVLEFGYAQKGSRCYLAIRGKWQIKEVMGSYSTYSGGKFGGINGRSLQKGDQISWHDSSSDFKLFEVPIDRVPYYSTKLTVDFVPGPEWSWLSKEAQKKLLNTEFIISSKSNRMGIRLESNSKIGIEKRDMRSSGVIPGIIQLPPNGLPIILMKDGQTVGGYPRIGKVLDNHMDRLAQLPLNGVLRFKKITEYL